LAPALGEVVVGEEPAADDGVCQALLEEYFHRPRRHRFSETEVEQHRTAEPLAESTYKRPDRPGGIGTRLRLATQRDPTSLARMALRAAFTYPAMRSGR
jgi:hypothetical protein